MRIGWDWVGVVPRVRPEPWCLVVRKWLQLPGSVTKKPCEQYWWQTCVAVLNPGRRHTVLFQGIFLKHCLRTCVISFPQAPVQMFPLFLYIPPMYGESLLQHPILHHRACPLHRCGLACDLGHKHTTEPVHFMAAGRSWFVFVDLAIKISEASPN